MSRNGVSPVISITTEDLIQAIPERAEELQYLSHTDLDRIADKVREILEPQINPALKQAVTSMVR